MLQIIELRGKSNFNCTWKLQPQRKNLRKNQRLYFLISSEKHWKFTTHSRFSTADQKLNVLLQKCEKYCNPRRNITFERHKFFTCIQEPTESIDQYVTELRTKASTCEFGELCKSLIRERIVCGISCNIL